MTEDGHPSEMNIDSLYIPNLWDALLDVSITEYGMFYKMKICFQILMLTSRRICYIVKKINALKLRAGERLE